MPPKRPKRVEQPRAGPPSGLVNHLPVLAAQDMFRMAVTSPNHHLTPMRDSGAPVRALTPADRVRLQNPSTTPSPVPKHSMSGMQSPTSIDAPHSSAGTQAVITAVQKAETYIRDELAILSTAGIDGMGSSQDRLAVFKTAFNMVMPVVQAPLQRLLEKVVNEHDRFSRALESQTGQHSMLNERKRIEEYYQQHYASNAAAKEREIDDARSEIVKQQQSLSHKFKSLETQVNLLKEENTKLRVTQIEDHERCNAMAQSVAESRQAALQAELQAAHLLEENASIKSSVATHIELVADHSDMMRLLKTNKIEFEPRCRFAIDLLTSIPSTTKPATEELRQQDRSMEFT